MKITYFNVISYGENTRKANLQELAEGMFQDKEVDYVKIKEQKVASLEAINVSGESSIFVKLKEYPYEFEIGSDLQLASVDQEKIEENKNNSIYKLGTYTSIEVSAGVGVYNRMIETNTIEINVKEKYKDYEKLTVDNFITKDTISQNFAITSVYAYMSFGAYSTSVISYDSNLGILKIRKPFVYYDNTTDSYDRCGTASTTIYIVENAEIPEL